MQLSFIKLHSFFTHKPISIQFLVKNCFYLIFELNLENGFHIGEMNLKISYLKPHLPIDLKIIFWPSFLLHNYFDAMIAFWFLRCLLWSINFPLSKMWFPNRYEKNWIIYILLTSKENYKNFGTEISNLARMRRSSIQI